MSGQISTWRMEAASASGFATPIRPASRAPGTIGASSSLAMATTAPSAWDLLPQDLDDHPLLALAIPFPVENPLPGAKIELPLGDGHDHLVTHRQAPEMGRRVVLARFVVLVPLRIPGRDPLEPLLDVVP